MQPRDREQVREPQLCEGPLLLGQGVIPVAEQHRAQQQGLAARHRAVHGGHGGGADRPEHADTDPGRRVRWRSRMRVRHPGDPLQPPPRGEAGHGETVGHRDRRRGLAVHRPGDDLPERRRRSLAAQHQPVPAPGPTDPVADRSRTDGRHDRRRRPTARFDPGPRGDPHRQRRLPPRASRRAPGIVDDDPGNRGDGRCARGPGLPGRPQGCSPDQQRCSRARAACQQGGQQGRDPGAAALPVPRRAVAAPGSVADRTEMPAGGRSEQPAESPHRGPAFRRLLKYHR